MEQEDSRWAVDVRGDGANQSEGATFAFLSDVVIETPSSQSNALQIELTLGSSNTPREESSAVVTVFSLWSIGQFPGDLVELVGVYITELVSQNSSDLMKIPTAIDRQEIVLSNLKVEYSKNEQGVPMCELNYRGQLKLAQGATGWIESRTTLFKGKAKASYSLTTSAICLNKEDLVPVVQAFIKHDQMANSFKIDY